MSRQKKHPKARQKNRPPRPTPEPTTDKVVDNTTAAFTSSHGVARDFLLYCYEELERMDMNLEFGQVAHEIWAGRPGPGPATVAAIAQYIAACQRHRDGLLALRPRFATLLEDHINEHIQPVEPCRELIRRRLFTAPESEGSDLGSGGHR